MTTSTTTPTTSPSPDVILSSQPTIESKGEEKKEIEKPATKVLFYFKQIFLFFFFFLESSGTLIVPASATIVPTAQPGVGVSPIQPVVSSKPTPPTLPPV